MPKTKNDFVRPVPTYKISVDIFRDMPPTALSETLDAVSDMVLVCVGGAIRHINAIGISILGASSENDLLGVNFQSLICDDFASSTDDILDVLADEDNATPMHIKGLNGVKFSLSIKVNRLHHMGEHAFVITAQNITDHLHLSQAIRDSEDRFGKLVDNALDFICVLQGGLITYVNKAGMQLLKAAHQDEVVGQPLDTFMHPNYTGILDGDLHEFISDGELLPMRFVDISQSPIDVELGIFMLEDTIHPRYMIEARDITAHNHAVRALRHSIENLERRVEERTRELSTEIVERKHAEELLQHIASHDGLTNLPNRSLLMDRLEQGRHRAHRANKKYAVLFIDLDGFKPINDTLGHDIGDLVLKTVSKRLLSAIRETDTAARFGGDEFVVLLTDLDSKDAAAKIAQKILDDLGQPMVFIDISAQVGASIGIAFYPDDADSAEGVLKRADDAMYAVKGSGKNAFVMAD